MRSVVYELDDMVHIIDFMLYATWMIRLFKILFTGSVRSSLCAHKFRRFADLCIFIMTEKLQRAVPGCCAKIR